MYRSDAANELVSLSSMWPAPCYAERGSSPISVSLASVCDDFVCSVGTIKTFDRKLCKPVC